jgi:hypothetical protein
VDGPALQVMVEQRQLDRCPMDSAEASSRLQQSRADLETARAVLAAGRGRNPKAACSLAWEATLESLLGWLSLFGYRITSERGHHAVAVRAVRAILDSREATALLQRLDGLRRLRDNALYNNLPVDAEEVLQFLPDIELLGDWLRRAMDHLAPGQPPTSRA